MASEKKGTLKADKNKPLESLSILIEDGNVHVPALSSYFVTTRQMLSFMTPPQPQHNGQFVIGAKDHWLGKMNIFKDNMLWLLSLSHNRFWSQIIYGKDSWDSVITFLQEAYPYYMMDNLPDDQDIAQLYFKIYSIVFRLIKRATSIKESESHWIGVKKFGSLLYNYMIISFPILLDICAIYGEHYKDDVQSIINTVFKAQPIYKDDLNNAVQSIKMVFQSIEDLYPVRTSEPGQVTKLSDRKGSGQQLPLSKVQDVIIYLLDVSASLSTFINYYPDAANVLHVHHFEFNISTLYETVIPRVSNSVKSQCFKDDAMDTYFNLTLKLNQSRYFLITLYRQCLEPVLNLILTKSGESKDPELISSTYDFVDTLSNSFTHKTFMVDYNNKYIVESELEMLAGICPDLDSEKIDFLKRSLRETCGPVNRSQPVEPVESSPSTSYSPPQSIFNNTITPPEPVIIPKPQDNLPSLIEEVKEIFPQLGDGFIERCLEHYKYSSPDVINAILEDSLHPKLNCLDRELPYIPPEFEYELQQKATVSQVNILDFNEFNKKSGNEDMMMGYRKQKDDNQSFNEFVNDKSFRNELRNKYTELGIIESLVDIYDDEYDDTYDGEVDVHEVGEPEIRKFVTPRVLQPRLEKESEEEEEEEIEQPKRNFEHFVENPEDVRARYEQKRASKMLRNPPRPRNVAGEPKEQDVLKSRNNKTVHKSTYANHNRKKGAKNKRSHGLVPS